LIRNSAERFLEAAALHPVSVIQPRQLASRKWTLARIEICPR
jgi:hypothetical protein